MGKNYFLAYRKLELYFQLELNIKELLENNSGGFCPEVGFHLKKLCAFVFLLFTAIIEQTSIIIED